MAVRRGLILLAVLTATLAFTPAPATVVNTTICASGCTYSTIAAWIAALPADLVAADEQHTGTITAAEVFDEGNLTIGAKTTDATRFIKLTVADAVWHHGTPGVGARIVESTNRAAGEDLLQVRPDYTVVERLEIVYTGAATTNIVSGSAALKNFGGNHVTFRQNLIHDINIACCNRGISQVTEDSPASVGTIVENNVIYAIGGSDGSSSGFRGHQGGAIVRNNSIYNVNGWALEVFGRLSGAAEITVKNNLACGGVLRDYETSGAAFSGNFATFAWANNLSCDATADDEGGTGNLVSQTAANVLTTLTAGSENLRLKTGSSGIAAGVSLGAGAWAFDVLGFNRMRVATWDVGGYQFNTTTRLAIGRGSH